MAPRATAPQSKGSDHVGTDGSTGSGFPARCARSSSVARRPLCRYSPKVGARCVNRARRDLCGGYGATRISTAIGECLISPTATAFGSSVGSLPTLSGRSLYKINELITICRSGLELLPLPLLKRPRLEHDDGSGRPSRLTTSSNGIRRWELTVIAGSE
jgi:hypothetical protein